VPQLVSDWLSIIQYSWPELPFSYVPDDLCYCTVSEFFLQVFYISYCTPAATGTAKPLLAPLALAGYCLNDFTGTSNTLFQICDSLTVTSERNVRGWYYSSMMCIETSFATPVLAQ